MTIRDWARFYQSMEIEPNDCDGVHKPSESQLDTFESAAGFRLPTSYRAYISAFGPGEFPGELCIAAPGYAELHPSLDLQRANEYYRLNEEDLAQLQPSPANLELLQRLFMFGSRRDQLWLGWDLSDIRDSDHHEYAIYGVEAYDDIQFIAASFQELVELVCDVMLAPDPLWPEEEAGPQRSFQPASPSAPADA